MMRKGIDSFSIHWEIENEVNPSDFPMEMDEGDWFEQLLTHIESKSE